MLIVLVVSVIGLYGAFMAIEDRLISSTLLNDPEVLKDLLTLQDIDQDQDFTEGMGIMQTFSSTLRADTRCCWFDCTRCCCFVNLGRNRCEKTIFTICNLLSCGIFVMFGMCAYKSWKTCCSVLKRLQSKCCNEKKDSRSSKQHKRYTNAYKALTSMEDELEQCRLADPPPFLGELIYYFLFLFDYKTTCFL